MNKQEHPRQPVPSPAKPDAGSSTMPEAVGGSPGSEPSSELARVGQGSVGLMPQVPPGPLQQAPRGSLAPTGHGQQPAHVQPSGYAPQPSGYAPQPSGYAPQQPGYAPQPSGYAPQQPGYAPQQPGYAPQPSGYAPQPSGYAPQQPGYAPQHPGYAPQQPGSAMVGYPSHGQQNLQAVGVPGPNGYPQQPVNVVVQNNLLPVPTGPNGMARLHDRNKFVAAILAMFVGAFGVHKFYLGHIAAGVMYLMFFWTGIPSIIAFIEGLVYLTKSEETFDREHNYR